MIPFNYHHLYYFYTIARLGSITRACAELRLAQPTLSSQLKQFENYLNLKLFERAGKKLKLTDEGRSVFAYAEEIFDAGKEMIDHLNDTSQPGRIKIQIGISNSTPKSLMDALLRFLVHSAPDARVLVSEDTHDNMLERLSKHALDLVITDIPAASSGDEPLESRLLAKIPVVFCANHKLAQKFKSIPRDLDNAPMILPTDHSQVYRALEEYFVENKIKPRIVAEIQDLELARRLALGGIGIAPLNEFTAKHAPSKTPLVILNPKLRTGIFDSVYLVTKKRRKPHPLLPLLVEKFKIRL